MASVKIGEFSMNVETHAGLLPMDTLFIHGNLASNTWWQPSLEIWRKAAQPSMEGRMMMAEWRGCGGSSHPRTEDELEMSKMATDYVQMLRETGVKKACVVAHSTGGLLALMAMVQAPELFDRVVLLDPVGPTGVKFGPEMYDVFTQMSQNRDVCAQVLGATIHGNDAARPLFQKLVDDAFSIGKLNWHGVARMLSKVDVTRDMSRIQQPVLVLHGEHDPVLPLAGSMELAKMLPNGSFKEIKDQGHSLNVENPTLFVTLVNEFLFQRN